MATETRCYWWKKAAIRIGICVAVMVAFYGLWRNVRPDFAGLRGWSEQQTLVANQTQTMPLPWHLCRGLATKEVEVERLADGTIVMLVKTSIGWKQNFEGYVVSTRPLPESAFYDFYGGRSGIGIGGISVGVRRQIDELTYAVFFDLG